MIVEARDRVEIIGRQRGAGTMNAIDRRRDITVARCDDVEGWHRTGRHVGDQASANAQRNARHQVPHADAVGKHDQRGFGEQSAARIE